MSKIATQHQNFASIRHHDEHGNEFWLARELAIVLDYIQWRNFVQVIDKAKEACENSGQNVADHIADFSNMVQIGSGRADTRLANVAKLQRSTRPIPFGICRQHAGCAAYMQQALYRTPVSCRPHEKCPERPCRPIPQVQE